MNVNDDFIKVPKWLKSYILEEGILKIESSVTAAERKTSGEIVPMIVERSSTIGHVHLSLSLIFTLILTISFFIFHIETYFNQLNLFEEVVFFSAGAIGTYLFILSMSRWYCVQRWLTPRLDQQNQVEHRAVREFYQNQIYKTKNSTGILIYVSLMERRAVVYGDKAISEKINQQVWRDVVDSLLTGIRNKKMAEGFCEAIEKCGVHLEEHFPVSENLEDNSPQGQDASKNELQNYLIIKD